MSSRKLLMWVLAVVLVVIQYATTDIHPVCGTVEGTQNLILTYLFIENLSRE